MAFGLGDVPEAQLEHGQSLPGRASPADPIGDGLCSRGHVLSSAAQVTETPPDIPAQMESSRGRTGLAHLQGERPGRSDGCLGFLVPAGDRVEHRGGQLESPQLQ